MIGTRRRLTNWVACGAITVAAMTTVIPLVAVLAYTVRRGLDAFSFDFLTHSMKGVGPLDATGGVYHAIVGTLEHVAIAFALAVPIGLAVAVYINEIGRGRLATSVRFLVDVMTGIPSIVAGLFVFSFWVIGLDMGFSGIAAGLAFAILMLPTVVKVSEEMLRLVPNELREASYALGVPRWRTVVSVVVPAAAGGITTGIVLAIARVAGETAPLLLTAFGYDAVRVSPVDGPQSGLPLFVFAQAGSAFSVSIDRAWAGALTLVIMVMLLTAVARLLARRRTLERS